MSEYTRAVFGSLQTGEADFASTYAQLQSTISTLDGQLKSSLSQWDGGGTAGVLRGQSEVGPRYGQHGDGAEQPAAA